MEVDFFALALSAIMTMAFIYSYRANDFDDSMMLVSLCLLIWCFFLWIFHTVVILFFPFFREFLNTVLPIRSFWMMQEYWYVLHPMFYWMIGLSLAFLMLAWNAEFDILLSEKNTRILYLCSCGFLIFYTLANILVFIIWWM